MREKNWVSETLEKKICYIGSREKEETETSGELSQA